MAFLQPDAHLIVAETGRKCRLGLIARDAANRFWGLTARHVMEEYESTTIKDLAGNAIGAFREAENRFGFSPGHALGQIVCFELERAAIAPDRVNYGVTWPRYAIEDSALLGATIVSVAAADREIGTVVEVDSLADIEFSDGRSLLIEGVIIVALDDAALVRSGQAGTLLLSEAGEAVGLGIATQCDDDTVEMIASPLGPFLARSGLRLWAPSGAHWTDLPHRARHFLNEVLADKGPDLGPPPRTERR